MYSHKYTDSMTEVNFLAGGIGTGTFSVGSRGQFKDFELFGSPGKGNYFPYCFYAIYVKPQGGEAVTRVLESELKPPFTRSNGYWVHEAAGLPRLKSAEMTVQYPFCNVNFIDKSLPVEVSLEVCTPFVPLDLKASSYPAAFIKYTVKNTGEVPVNVTIAGTMPNMSGVEKYQRETWEGVEYLDHGITDFIDENGLHGFYCHPSKLEETDRHYGSLALVTPDKDITYKKLWLNRGNWDGLNEFWQDISQDGLLEPEPTYTAKNAGRDREYKISSLGICKIIEPGETQEFNFIFSWYYPNREGSWYDISATPIRLHFANYFKNALEVAKSLYQNQGVLVDTTRKFTDALYESTLPDEVLDALGANLTIIRSPTCFIRDDGTFLGWEGCFRTSGCCEGNCTHVYNYAQTLAFLFPELEQSMGKTSFLVETGEDGNMAFRTQQAFGGEKSTYHPAVDGQMGTIIRLYRDWKLSGDDDYLKLVWKKAKLALDFAFAYWDSDGDNVLDSQQHNTYDIEFYHPNSLANSMFLGALTAACRMAEHLGDTIALEKYSAAYKDCSKKIDVLLWGGEYYIQAIDDVDEYVYQYGKGCLSDQIFGQTLAHVAGLGYILPQDKVQQSMQSIYKYNFIKDMKKHSCVQRTYALNDEQGLALCTWPHGGRPKIPFIYSDEIWAGVEYMVASHLIYENMVDEGLTLVRATRARYDGMRRDPFCEVECGNYYVRSMASWALLISLSGYSYDLVKGEIGFDPKINQEDFHCFFSHGKAWGIYHQNKNEVGEIVCEVEVLYGSNDGIKLV